MNREELLNNICLTKIASKCFSDPTISCRECYTVLNTYLDEYDKHVIAQYEAKHGNLADTIREIHDCVAKEMYCKGIDDFIDNVKEHQYLLSDKVNSTDYGMFTCGLYTIAEQLKE